MRPGARDASHGGGEAAMTSATHEGRRPRGLRAVAWVALAALSCTTVRVPASAIEPTVKLRGEIPEPQIELWVESGKDVSPEERAEYAADARAALEQALASRRIAAGEQLLVVRAQGVSRTGSRRSDQKAAIAGLVVVGVAIVAVAIVAIVASKGHAGSHGSAPAPRVAPPPATHPAPPPGVPAPRPPPPAPVARVPPVRPSGTPGHAHVAVGVGVNVAVPVAPNGAPPPAVWSESVVTAPTPGPTPVPEEPVAEVSLRVPPPMNVAGRGFFAGDLTRLELTLVDRATSRPLWVKTVERGIDPRNAAAVQDLLADALDEPGGWEPAEAAP
jgi:hypothetical protein